MTCTRLLMGCLRSLARPILLGGAVSVAASESTATAATFTNAAFTETTISGLSQPTAMSVAPDGRIFVCEKAGALRVVVQPGVLLPTPFLSLSVNLEGERGLLGVAFDPDFVSNQFVYLYYTTATSPIHNRVSRFTANGSVVVPGSELPILDLETLGPTNHNGGAIHFGPDGKLYVAVGDNANGSNSQTLANRLGKILRINKDGTIPADNPFFNQASGANRAIWAMGLRNPFTFAFDGNRARMFINDVGGSAFEEINEGAAGSNYGWPNSEGPTNNPSFKTPFHSYVNEAPTCALTGGAFYSPSTATQFPGAYTGDYFFADLCAGWIDVIDRDTRQVTRFATGIANPVDITVGLDGSLYYLAFGSGTLARVTYTNTAIVSPVAPVLSAASTNGLSFRLSWARTDMTTSYILNVRTIDGTPLLDRDVGDVSTLEGVAPQGAYRVHVRGTNGVGTSMPSNEEIVTLAGATVCATPPQPPKGYKAQVGGVNVLLTWDKTFAATSYVLEAGSTPGGVDQLIANVGNVASLTATAPPTTYFTRLRAVNACGTSTPSAEVPVTLSCNVPAPSGLVATKTGAIVRFTWNGSPGATGYRALVGTQPGASNVLDVQLGAGTSVSVSSAGVPAGNYHVRIVATTSCGASGPSNEAIVTVQ